MSQEYTPVDWVDETTSQQGTLINAERLDQMQTAHHYADGFEEVDAIPTEDPGVDYHKIVYCTADTTFYRWDGTQWTADIDEDTKHLLDQEIARATAAEGELAQDIEDEAAARAQADTALGERITAEAGAREGADTALGARIDAEAQYREDVDRQLWDAIGGLNGETIPVYSGSRTPTIQNSLAANAGLIENLTSVVDGLSYDLGQEVTNRENADTQLAADITAEVQARAAAIASLQAGVYTKTEADNLLAGKADTTALTDGSVTKVGTADLGTDTKPIKLVGGVPTAVGHDLVTTDTPQTIPGAKTFTNTLAIQSGVPYIQMKSTSALGTNQYLGFIQEVDSGGAEIFDIYPTTDSAGKVSLNVAVSGGGTMKVPTPPSGATDASAVNANWVSQTGDEAPNNLIHKSGAEVKNGTFTVANTRTQRKIQIRQLALDVTNPGANGAWCECIHIQDANGILIGSLDCRIEPSGRARIFINVRNADGTTKSVFIAEGNE